MARPTGTAPNSPILFTLLLLLLLGASHSSLGEEKVTPASSSELTGGTGREEEDRALSFLPKRRDKERRVRENALRKRWRRQGEDEPSSRRASCPPTATSLRLLHWLNLAETLSSIGAARKGHLSLFQQ